MALASGAVVAAAILSSCARRPPVLVPPASGVEAVAGFAAASVRGEAADIKGKFAFLFRRPGLGRVEVLDPLGRAVYNMIFTGETAYLVVPRRKVYAEDRPEAMVERFLGFALGPGEILGLLSGQWLGQESDAPNAWTLRRDGQGRVIRGERDGLIFEVGEFFPGAGVPRTVVFSRPGTSGRVKVLSLEFNPAARPEAFETPFLKTFARKSVEDIQEIRDDAP
jgi:outer membrane biogenesis lipoprotein LolB